MTTFCSFSISDTGVHRELNEDYWAAIPKKFYAIADGLGGYPYGEIAASMLIKDLCTQAKKISPDWPLYQVTAYLKQAILSANSNIFFKSDQNLRLRGMATTLCCLLFHRLPNNSLYLIQAHVGDSRLYRFRNELTLLTQDHVPKDLVGKVTHVVNRAIGRRLLIKPEIHFSRVEPGDTYLICSDGVSDYVLNTELSQIISSEPDLEKCCLQLINTAKKNRSRDNITVQMIKIS